ncbi:MAG: hypothetical protein QW128_07230 [Thermoprotei archaeon]
MLIYHDKELVKKVWEVKRKHPDWGIRRIGEVLGVTKDKMHRILKRIERGDIEVTEKGEVIDRSEPKGIIAKQRVSAQRPSVQQLREPEAVEASSKPQSEALIDVTQSPQQDPLEALLKGSWKVEYDWCGRLLDPNWNVYNLIDSDYDYVTCLKCVVHPLSIPGIFSYNHKVFIRLADVFRAYLQGSRIVRTKTRT